MCIVYYKIDHRKRSGKLIKILKRAREMFGWYVQKSRSLLLFSMSYVKENIETICCDSLVILVPGDKTEK